MTKKADLVTIALHTGYTPNYPLVENILKSFLICNEYPNIEFILIETGENDDLREWYTNLDFDSEFVNFDGTKTTIKKKPDVNIEKRTLFLDELEGEWISQNTDDGGQVPGLAYCNAMKTAIKEAKGKYFCFLVEDYQFNITGNMIGDHINALKMLGEEKSLLLFFTPHRYKVFQPTNVGPGCTKVSEGVFVYPTARCKFDPFTFMRTSIYDELGEGLLPTKDEPNRFILDYAKRAEKAEFSRYYSFIPGGVHFPNYFNKWAINEIKEGTKKDPNYVLFATTSKERFVDGLKHSNAWPNPVENPKFHVPITTEDFYHSVNRVTNLNKEVIFNI